MSDHRVPEGWFVVNPRHMADLKAALATVERVQGVADRWASAPLCGTTAAHEEELREALGEHRAQSVESVTCNWPRCNSPRTGKCFAWCQCRCHDARARSSWAEKHYTEPCESCGARVGEPCRTASGYVTTRHASRRKDGAWPGWTA